MNGDNKTEDKLNPLSTDFCALDYPCAYLPEKKTRMYYKYVNRATKEFAQAVIERGWRRFGNFYFFPICNGCSECKSLRICVSEYNYSKSQRRVIRKNEDTHIVVKEPSISTEHIRLYMKYHNWKSDKDGWNNKDITYKEYYENFVEGAYEFGKEVLYFRDNKLVGVDLIDILEDGISSIYFFYDPDYSKLSLGTFSLLYQINLAKRYGLEYIYLGYWVEGCKAFAYKPKFKPQQLLDGFPSIYDKPNWKYWNYKE